MSCPSCSDPECATCGGDPRPDPVRIERRDQTRLYCCRGCAPNDEDPENPEPARARGELRLGQLGDEHVDFHRDGTASAELHLEGIHCSSCVRTVERMSDDLDGVVEARLSLARERLRVRFRPDVCDLAAIDAWLDDYGYRAHPLDEEESGRALDRERELLGRVGICWALAANVMMLTVPLYAGLVADSNSLLFHGARWTCLFLASLTILVGGRSFFDRAWSSIAALDAGPLQLSMDVPISVGIAAGWTHSVWSTVAGTGEVWFDSISVLIAALLTARWLKARGRRRAVDASSRLAELIPGTARPAGRPDDPVPVEDLESGANVVVRPGERLPVDGEVIEGRSAVSRAILTGESRPVPVQSGDEVFAGVENLTDPLLVEATSLGSETRVGRMMDWLDDHGDQSRATQFADRFGGAFVLATLAAAAATAAYWSATAGPADAVEPVVALLVIACPCALGLAAPLASTVASGRAAERGIFVEQKGVLETIRRAGAVVFDKTGTLTAGRTRLVEHRGSNRALALASTLENHSRHPLAAAFDRKGAGDCDVREIEETAGAGIAGRVDGHDVRVGRPDWVRRSCQRLHPDLRARETIGDFSSGGLTPVAVGVDGELRALVGIGDPLRPGARDLSERLEASGRRVMLLSGDHPETVSAVAGELGVDEARGGLDPEQKVHVLRQLRTDVEGPVAMVGDGVNDTVALEEADVGIAVGNSADAALDAADVVCRRPGVEPVTELLDGAESLGRTVRGLLAASVGYNLAAVAAAAAGWVDPLAAAILMPASSTTVVLAALWQPAFQSRTRAETRPDTTQTDTRTPPGDGRLARGAGRR